MPTTFTDEATWYASLATMYGTAAALITSPSGDVLLVKPNYRELWSLPGGVLEDGEPPHVGCAREVREELGLAQPVGPLLAVAWIAPEGVRPKPVIAPASTLGAPCSAMIPMTPDPAPTSANTRSPAAEPRRSRSNPSR